MIGGHQIAREPRFFALAEIEICDRALNVCEELPADKFLYRWYLALSTA